MKRLPVVLLVVAVVAFASACAPKDVKVGRGFATQRIVTVSDAGLIDPVVLAACREAGLVVSTSGGASPWYATHESEEPPKRAERRAIRRFSVSIRLESPSRAAVLDPSIADCRVSFSAWRRAQVDTGGGRFAWARDEAVFLTLDERRKATMILERLRRELPKPDPDAPPPK